MNNHSLISKIQTKNKFSLKIDREANAIIKFRLKIDREVNVLA